MSHTRKVGLYYEAQLCREEAIFALAKGFEYLAIESNAT